MNPEFGPSRPTEENNQEGREEREQTPEQIREILAEAMEKGLIVDLVVAEIDTTELKLIPRLIIEEIVGDKERGDYAMVTYLDAKGEFGESIPLDLARIKKAELKGVYKSLE